MSDALVERLSKIDTCALSDAMDRVGLKGVAYGIDATVSVGSNEAYGLNLRKDLGNNIEAAASYCREAGVNTWGLELAYNVSKQIQLAVGYSDSNAAGSKGTTDLTVRYNF